MNEDKDDKLPNCSMCDRKLLYNDQIRCYECNEKYVSPPLNDKQHQENVAKMFNNK